ncbi:MAG: flagellar basal body L-ring protein FlgH [Methylococcaceae bacterium]|nr:flagellar basal body L-ring protein FlgH [Methylococcaceae bacterium]
MKEFSVKLYQFISVMAVAMLLSACENAQVRDAAFAPVAPANLRPPAQNTGAIYQSGYDMRLFEDRSAKRIGDILTVRLVENTNASKKSDLNASKDSKLEVSVPSLWGLGASVFGGDLGTKASAADAFKGGGSADQSNRLMGDITVTVVDVLPNGTLKIRGEKRVTLNRGSEYVRLSGMVRTVDIDAANTIISTKVADATIMYTGDGAMADSSKAGWLSRFFLSPLFPL